MLRVLVIYDISNDRIRLKVSETCLDYGLDRLQYSVFTGLLKPVHMRELSKRLKKLTKEDGHILVLPVSADDWQRRVSIGVSSC